MAEKKTKAMYFNELRTIVETLDMDQEQQNEMLEFIDKELATLEARKEAAAKRAAKKKQESDELTDKIYAVLDDDEYMTVDNIVEALDDAEVTRNKVTARLKKLVDNGLVEKEKIKIEGIDGKRMAYVKADKPDVDAE